MFDSSVEVLHVRGYGLLREGFWLHRFPVSMHVVRDVVRMKSSKLRSVMAIQFTEEVEIYSGLQCDSFPPHFWRTKLVSKLRDNRRNSPWTQPQFYEFRAKTSFEHQGVLI